MKGYTMARAFYVKKARKPIYEHGSTVAYEGKKGTKREGRKMSKLDRTVPNPAGDTVLIQKGEAYYYWQFRTGPIHYSKTMPKRHQLTQSSYLSWLYDFEDDIIGAYSAPEKDEDLLSFSPSDLESARDEWLSEIESQKDELQEKLDNMPDALRESSSSGQLLQERIDALDQLTSDLEGVDIDWDDDELKEQAEAEWDQLHPKALLDADPALEKEKPSFIEEKFLDLKREKIEEIIQELQSFSADVG
jgi:hypothetical protein